MPLIEKQRAINCETLVGTLGYYSDGARSGREIVGAAWHHDSLPSARRGSGCVLARPSPPGTVPPKEIVPLNSTVELPFDKHASTSPHIDFLPIYPVIRRHAMVAFRHLLADQREDAAAEAVAAGLGNAASAAHRR